MRLGSPSGQWHHRGPWEAADPDSGHRLRDGTVSWAVGWGWVSQAGRGLFCMTGQPLRLRQLWAVGGGCLSHSAIHPRAPSAHHMTGAELSAKPGARLGTLSFSGAQSRACSPGGGGGSGFRAGRWGSLREDLKEAQVELKTYQTNDCKQLLSTYCILCIVLCFISFHSTKKELLPPFFLN